MILYGSRSADPSHLAGRIQRGDCRMSQRLVVWFAGCVVLSHAGCPSRRADGASRRTSRSRRPLPPAAPPAAAAARRVPRGTRRLCAAAGTHPAVGRPDGVRRARTADRRGSVAGEPVGRRRRTAGDAAAPSAAAIEGRGDHRRVDAATGPPDGLDQPWRWTPSA